MKVKADLPPEHMTPEQLLKLLQIIQEDHSFYTFCKGSKKIKYVRPNYDTRFGDVFSITLDRFVFDYRQSKKPLFDRIVAWLNGSADPEDQPDEEKLADVSIGPPVGASLHRDRHGEYELRMFGHPWMQGKTMAECFQKMADYLKEKGL